MNETIEVTAMLCKCFSCEQLKPIFVGFCGNDICLDCAVGHYQVCPHCAEGVLFVPKNPKRGDWRKVMDRTRGRL